MTRTIAIIAPLIDFCQFNVDFNLRLRKSDRELSLITLHEFARTGFNPDHQFRAHDYSDDIPSAGFYLQGLLHMHGYRTILTNRYDPESLEKLAKEELFAVIVSTTMVITTASLLSLFSAIREKIPGVPVIAGGVFLWKSYLQYEQHLRSPEQYPAHPGMLFQPANSGIQADVLIAAPHGISSMMQVLGETEKGSRASLMHIPNLCLPSKNGFVFTKREDETVDYNRDYTRWDLVDEIFPKIPVRTSIGCPYRCGFCDFCQLYPRIFMRSPQSLNEELTLIKNRLGGKSAVIHVSDDNVFITKKRVHEVCGAIEASGIRNWVGFMRGGDYSDGEISAMQRSGLRMGIIGVESGDQGQLERMNKKQQAPKVQRSIEQLDAAGIAVLMTFVVGYPGETDGTISNTIGFLNGLSLKNLMASYQVYPLQIFSLSELTEPATRKKWQIEGFGETWSHYSMNSARALEACHRVFASVTNVPYHYAGESHFFNRGMFNYETRKALFQLRQQLTLSMASENNFPQSAAVFRELISRMGFTAGNTDEGLQAITCRPGAR